MIVGATFKTINETTSREHENKTSKKNCKQVELVRVDRLAHLRLVYSYAVADVAGPSAVAKCRWINGRVTDYY